MESAPVVRFGPFTIDRVALELRRDAVRVELAPMGVVLLLVLVDHAGQLVTREELYHRLWPEGGVDTDRGLNTLIRQVRIALEDSATRPVYLRTYPRRGYRFELPQEASAPRAGRDEEASDRVVGEEPPVNSSHRWRPAGVAVSLCLVIGLGAWTVLRGSEATPAQAASPATLEMAEYMLRRPLGPDVPGALNQLREAAVLHGDSPHLHALFVEAFVLAGQVDSARAHEGELPDSGVAGPEVLFARSLLATAHAHDWKRAEALVMRATTLRPSDPRFLTHRAFLAALLRDTTTARSAIRAVLELRPRTAYLVADVGYIALYVGDIAVAQTACERALVLEPGLASAGGCLATAALLQGDTARALSLQSPPDDPPRACTGEPVRASECLAALVSRRSEAAERRLATGQPTYRDIRWAIEGGRTTGLAEPIARLLSSGSIAALTLAVDPRTARVADDPAVATVLRQAGLLSE